MKKKLVSVLLAAGMALGLAACGSTSSATATTATKAESTASSAAASTSKSASSEAAGSSASSSSSSSTTSSASSSSDSSEMKVVKGIEPMELIFTTSKNETSEMGDIIKNFTNYVTEASDGAITFNIYWGGTLCSMKEELDMVGSGSVDVCMLNPLPFANQLPMAQAPNGTANSYEGTAAYVQNLFFDNADTAALIQGNFEENGLHYVGAAINGNSGYYCTFEAKSLEDMKGKKFGTGQSGALQKEYGLNVVSMATKDGYDNLSRGVVDCADSSMASAYTSSWAEVTSYWVFYNYVTYGNFFSINKDKWDSFSDDVKDIFNRAGLDTLQYSTERISGLETDIQKDVQDNYGVTITFVEDNDFALKDFTIRATNAMENAKTVGKVDDMKAVITEAADSLGFDVSAVLANY